MPRKIELPVAESVVRELRVGDEVEFSGNIVTGRDAAHKYLVKTSHDATFDQMARGTFLYHCGPVVRKAEDGSYSFVAAGPTTSRAATPSYRTNPTPFGRGRRARFIELRAGWSAANA